MTGMTALERVLRSRGVVSLAGDVLSGPNVAPLKPANTTGNALPAVKDVTEQPAPGDPGGYDSDDPTDERWAALQTMLTGEADVIATAIDTAGPFSDVQTAVQMQDENRLQVALYQFMAAARMTFTNSAVDAAVGRITNAVNTMLGADDDSDDLNGNLPVALSHQFGDGPVVPDFHSGPVKLSWDEYDAARPKKDRVSAFRALNDQAYEATDKARLGPENTYAAHKKAADLHAQAGKMATDLGMHADAADHMVKATQHGDVARSLAKAASAAPQGKSGVSPSGMSGDQAERELHAIRMAKNNAVKASHPATDKLVRLAASIDTDARDKMADSGVALDDGSFPIPDVAHLRSAIKLRGSGKKPKSEVEAHIKKRAKALGAESELPDDLKD